MRNWLRRLLDRVVYGSSSLRDYEARCFRLFYERLPGVEPILREQVNSVSIVQRFANDKLVTFHFRSKPELLAPNQTPEARIARLVLSDGMHCDLVFHRGVLSSLEFNHPPRRTLSDKFNVERVEVYQDLLGTPDTHDSLDVSKPPLSKLCGEFSLTDIMPPARRDRVLRFRHQLATSVPLDYLELLGQTDGFTLGSWQFLGTKARNIVLDDVTLIVAAESDTEGLCFSEGSDVPEVLRYSSVDGSKQVFDSSFVSALERVLGDC